MSKRFEVNLVASAKMSEGGEDDIIRFTRKGRERLGFSTETLRLGSGEYQTDLVIRQAYREDVQKLTRAVQRGKMTEEATLLVGFISKSTHRRIAAQKGPTPWVTEGVGNITIGCDPEFGLINESGKLLARGDVVLPGTKKSAFGEDGPGVEVRPNPSRDHLKVVANIGKILSEPPEAAEDFQWIGGATYRDSARVYWFGGHIHLGKPSFVPPTIAPAIFRLIAKVLDHNVALPVVCFDTPNPQFRRNGCTPHHYGKAGDIRLKGEGSNDIRFEYRVLSGLWLVHPTLASIMLGASKAVAEAVYSLLAEKSELLEPDGSILDEKQSVLNHFKLEQLRKVSQIINAAQVSSMEVPMLEAWETRMRTLSTYDYYAEEVEALIELVKASPDQVVPQISVDLRENWGEGRSLLTRPNPKLKAAIKAVETKK